MRANLSRLAPLSGVVFAVLVAGVIVAGGNTPDSDASTQKVVAYYTSHHGHQQAAAYMLGYGALFTIVFAAALRSHLRSRSASDGLLALGFGGSILFAVALAVGSSATSAVIDSPAKISPSAEQALSVLSNNIFFAALAVGLCAFGIANGIAIVRSRVLPVWLGWLAIVIGIAAGIPPITFFALFAVVVWAVIAAIVMFMREGQAAPAAAGPSPA